MPSLLDPLTIRDVTFPNRIVMSPMCMYACNEEDGKVNDWHLVHYTSRAVGQVGLIIVEASAVQSNGRISAQDLGIWSDEHIEGMRRLVEMVHAQGARIGIQLAHAGRKATVPGAIAPSAVPFSEEYAVPAEMTQEDIRKTIKAFADAARRAELAGFDVVEIHAAHGYLINEFLSPLTNKRLDGYGENIIGRYRFLEEIIDAVRPVWLKPLFVRISANEYHKDGNTLETFIDYARRMKSQGVDLIDCSSGAVVPADINVYPGYQVPYAEAIRQSTGIATGAVGLITKPSHAEDIVRNHRADLVLLGRELLRDPYWPLRASKELRTDIPVPKSYMRSW
ncbi:NADPH dehydrogenase NamA [Paenibacillus sp. UMB4589-SE434]|uniref:NADPH dehydrogenase NamA n=1 Tax=Paenibacillus sp. UMB4589-SE434 TaxID=3046314 RepID=UPI00254E056B|nr:NADPH dehydrogenase NamA [Paenibacillus sp. UMB4589-SE434]MDK8183437.1 NADPH dehydrogenase NamA [Paenibacillus sp. UMB4589-SE434]